MTLKTFDNGEQAYEYDCPLCLNDWLSPTEYKVTVGGRERMCVDCIHRYIKASNHLQELKEQHEPMFTYHEEQVLGLRFGLDGKGFKTLEQVGKTLGVTRERIRQVEAKAIAKMDVAPKSQLEILEKLKEEHQWKTSAYTIG